MHGFTVSVLVLVDETAVNATGLNSDIIFRPIGVVVATEENATGLTSDIVV